jgi:hypothetical protein
MRAALIFVAFLVGLAAYAALRLLLPPGLAVAGAAWLACLPLLLSIAYGGRTVTPQNICAEPREEALAPPHVSLQASDGHSVRPLEPDSEPAPFQGVQIKRDERRRARGLVVPGAGRRRPAHKRRLGPRG